MASVLGRIILRFYPRIRGGADCRRLQQCRSAAGASHSFGRRAGAKSSGNRTSFRRSKGGAGGKRNPHNHASKISLDFFSELGQERALPLERESNAPILCGLGHRQGDGTRRAVVAPFVDDFITDANFFGRSRGAVQRHFRTLPPRLKRILLDAALHRYGAIRNLTRIVDAQNLTFLVGEGVSVVLIERTPAITARRS